MTPRAPRSESNRPRNNYATFLFDLLDLFQLFSSSSSSSSSSSISSFLIRFIVFFSAFLKFPSELAPIDLSCCYSHLTLHPSSKKRRIPTLHFKSLSNRIQFTHHSRSNPLHRILIRNIWKHRMGENRHDSSEK